MLQVLGAWELLTGGIYRYARPNNLRGVQAGSMLSLFPVILFTGISKSICSGFSPDHAYSLVNL